MGLQTAGKVETHGLRISEGSPESRKHEIRLLAKTSGAISVKMCSVANKRKIWPEGGM